MLVLRVPIVTVAPVVGPLTAEPDGAVVAGLAEPVELGPELPHAVRSAAAPASTGAAHQRVRITTSPFIEPLRPFYPPPT